MLDNNIRVGFVQLGFTAIFIFTLTLSTLLFGIRYGRTMAHHHGHIISVQECPTTRSSPMWDVHHVPNPPPVYTDRTFEPISDLKSFTSLDVAVKDKSWEQITQGGFLHVRDGSDEIQGYGVSMFHQIHCLNMIRNMLLDQPMSHAHEASDWTEDKMHWLHCLDYLAQVSTLESMTAITRLTIALQGVLCAADDTLEKSTFTRDFQGRLVSGIDGMHHVHQCRNSTRLMEVVIGSEMQPVHASTIGSTTVFPPVGLDSEGKPWIISES